MLGRNEKCSQDLLIFQISSRVLVLPGGRLFLRPGAFENPPGGISQGLSHKGGPYNPMKAERVIAT